MDIQLKIDTTNLYPFLNDNDFKEITKEVELAREELLRGSGKGNDFLGWINLPANIDPSLIKSIQQDADEIAKKAQLFVVIGIGGSYLGAKAVIDSLQHSFQALNTNRNAPMIIYAGHTLSEDYMQELIEMLDKYDYALTVISKSGTTTEPALTFRILKNHIEKKYGKEEASTRIIAITDAYRGTLKQQAEKEGYKTYAIPDNVGGRFSVLTPVGLLPIAVAGFDIEKLLSGAIRMREHCLNKVTLKDNIVLQYVAARNLLYRKNKKTELLVSYLPQLVYFTEWWKQLFGESEGKEHKGIFPAGVNFTTDLHSMGQYIQDGERMLFETILYVEKAKKEVLIPVDQDDRDDLNFLVGKSLTYINHMASLGTSLAHLDGGVPNMNLIIPALDEETLGELIFFFEFACGVSGYVLQVNPFDQPGVEAYKKNMFALLAKPGHEKDTKEIRNRLSK